MLNTNDSVPVNMWVNKLRASGDLLYYRHEMIESDQIFELALMTKFGRECSLKYNLLLCLDSTHKTTQYGYNFFTLVTKTILDKAYLLLF